MRNGFTINGSFFFLLILLITVQTKAQNNLSGSVKDKDTGKPLPGAIIFLPDLKTGTNTNKEGIYYLKDLPSSNLILQVSHLGYKAEVIPVNPAVTHNLDFVLIPTAIEAKEIVITGNALTSENDRSSISITPIPKTVLMTTPATNLVNTISAVPGVSAITTGGEISKPVIRGLGYNRIVTINEGVRQEGNQWGDEHGIEIDQFSADRIEVIKGPASLFYGSDAMGGVINILEQTPAAMGTVNGEWVLQCSGNERMVNSSLMLQGNQKGIFWRVRGSWKDAASFRSPGEWVYNSGFDEKNFSVMTGIIRKWGYTHLHVSSFNAKTGMTEGERDSATGRFIDREGNIVDDERAKSRNIDVPFQKIGHQKITSVSNLLFGKHQVRISAGFQRNNRKEFGEYAAVPGLNFLLDTWTFDARYTLIAGKSTELVGGISGMSQKNRNKGTEFLIPDYDLMDFGGFIYLKKSFEKTTYNLGIRFDHRNVHGLPLYQNLIAQPFRATDTVFRDFATDFSAFTGSAGMTYKPNRNLNFKFNVGRGFRAPNISELSANGLHEGTFRYEIGNTQLKPETSLQFDGEISWENRFLDLTLNAFYNLIDQFIYYRHADNEYKMIDGTAYPVYRYTQGNSRLTGFEIEADYHPVPAFHFDNSLDYVRGDNLTSGNPLPFIPALHLTDQLKYTFKTNAGSRISKPYLQFEVETHFAQERIDEFETRTPGYVLLNFTAGTNLKIGNQVWTIFLGGKNMTNVRYFDHLSRMKEAGIYEIGRNVTFGLVLPFGLVNN